jgi:hypothetical protein
MFARVLMWALRGLALLAARVSVFLLVYLMGDLGGYADGGEFYALDVFFVAVMRMVEGFVVAIVLLAAAEILNVVLGIEENTRKKAA